MSGLAVDTLATSVLFALAAISMMMVATWLVSLRLRDASIADVVWGPGFVLAAWVYLWRGSIAAAAPSPGLGPRRLLLVLVTIWGLRLAWHVARRGRGQGEDYRYAAMRRRHGDAFAWRSLFTVFGVQGILIVVISLPLAVALAAPTPRGWHPLHVLGALLWLVGFFFEAVGDRQLARFKADPANRGRVLDSGLWRYTRHPNYFGDALLWWGYYAFACAVPGGFWTLPAPLLMTFLLLRVSGVALLERTIAERRPAYRDYVESTSAFIPWPPKR